MNDSKKAQQKIAFYGALVLLLRDEKFVKSSAEALVALFEEIKSDVILTDVTIDSLRETYEELRDTKQDLDLIQQFTEDAFADLAKHMRSPEVRRIFKDLMDMSGTGSYTDLFVREVNVRPLTDETDGCAVVTLVVHDYGRLQKLLKQEGDIEVVHYSA